MSEKPPSKEGKKLSAQEQDHLEQGAHYMEGYVKPEVVQLSAEECAEQVENLLNRISSFEGSHDLAALHVITSLTVEEARAHPARQAARAELSDMVVELRKLEQQDAVTDELYSHLIDLLTPFDLAIGVTNGKHEVDHTHPMSKIRRRDI